MNSNSEEKIDFVVTYLDSTDEAWQRERAKYSSEKYDSRNSEARYRNMDNFQYWFRAVERYAPWVNKIHVVTWGHIPEWLDTTNPKINIVKHEDYIPKEYLPTFNSNVLDLNLDRIPGLSERFVYFNDDLFLNSETNPTDFFKKGLPLYQFMYTPVLPVDEFNTVIFNNTLLLNRLSFKKRALTAKILNIKNGKRALFFNLYLAPLVAGLKRYVGFYPNHLSRPLTKKAYKELREAVPEIFEQTSRHKFRTNEDISVWVVEDYLKARQQFYPINLSKFGLYQEMDEGLNYEKLLKLRRKVICFNDVEGIDFEEAKESLNKALNEKFSQKSCYEL